MLTRRAGTSSSQTWGLAVEMHGAAISDLSSFHDAAQDIVLQRADEMRKSVSGSGVAAIMGGAPTLNDAPRKSILMKFKNGRSGSLIMPRRYQSPLCLKLFRLCL